MYQKRLLVLWCVILIQSSFHFSVTDSVDLQISPDVVARCGENVTLTCNVTSKLSKITLFDWMGVHKTKLTRKDPQSDPEVLCQNTTNGLSLTLLNVMPVDQGEYLCKLHSTQGTTDAKTVVKVRGECFHNQLFYCCCFFFFLF